MSHTFKKIVPKATLEAITSDYIDPKANDRRKVANGLHDNWFLTNGMKLGRDYMLEMGSVPPSSLPVSGYWRNYEVSITIQDTTKALLFKLTHGGNV